jgi:hypothetical protein
LKIFANNITNGKTNITFVTLQRSIYRWGYLKNEPWYGKYPSLSLVKLNYYFQVSNAIPVTVSRDWGFIALFPVTVLADSLKIGFDYQWVSGILTVQINSSYR